MKGLGLMENASKDREVEVSSASGKDGSCLPKRCGKRETLSWR